MEKKNYVTWAAAATFVVGSLISCGIDMPKETQSSFETMTVEKSDIELPYKFSARMKGQNDVTVTPQVSGQLMKICVAEGQQVKKGQTRRSLSSTPAMPSSSWRLHRLTCRLLWLRRTLPSWSMSRTRTSLTRRS